MTALHLIDDSKCQGDGVCVEVCNKQVLAVVDGKARTVEERAHRCFTCGQCVAACPTGALAMPQLAPDALFPLSSWGFGFDELKAFLCARRSVRTFKNQPVERALLERVVEAAATAPMSFAATTEILVIDRKDELDFLRERLRADYAKLLAVHRNPVGRLVIRMKRGAEIAHSLESHVLKIVADNNERADKLGQDRYLYDAPALLLFHANRWSVGYQENACIGAAWAALGAHALGLGATLLSIVPPCFNNFPELKPRWKIPEDNLAVIALIVGHPKFKFARGIRRQLKDVRFA